MLHLIIQLSLTAVASTEGPTKVLCDGVIFNHVYYDRELVVTNFGRPYNLVFHKFSGYLFFSHTKHSVGNVDFAIVACHYEKRKCFAVKGVEGGYAITYDSGNDDIFMGGHDGIYKYNFLTKSGDFFGEEGKSIWGLFVRRNFYYIEYPRQRLFVLQDDDFVEVAEAVHMEVDHFFISKQKDVYFANKTALFKVNNLENGDLIVLSDELRIRQIVDDGYGDIYFCTSDGIYMVDNPLHRVKKVADVGSVFGLAFDEYDHVIYSDGHSVYKLLPSEFSKECYEAIMNVESEGKMPNSVI